MDETTYARGGNFPDLEDLVFNYAVQARKAGLSDREIAEHLEEWAALHRWLHGDYLAHLPYDDYLQTADWQERRLERLKLAEERCELCNSDKRLNVHHRTYERRGREVLTDLIVLCRDCHAKFHDKVPA